jgi:hypothetical protein
MIPPRLLWADTSAEARRIQVERWRAMPAWRKAELVELLSRDCETLALAGIRERHPTASAREARLHLGALRLSRSLMIEAFDWDPADRGL